MIPYAHQEVTKRELALLDRVRGLVLKLPASAAGKGVELSCHIVAHALGAVLDLRVIDGDFTVGCDHSWLLTDRGNILDPYPPLTCGGPVLVVTQERTYSPWHQHIYKEGEITHIWTDKLREHIKRCEVALLKLIKPRQEFFEEQILIELLSETGTLQQIWERIEKRTDHNYALFGPVEEMLADLQERELIVDRLGILSLTPRGLRRAQRLRRILGEAYWATAHAEKREELWNRQLIRKPA